MNTANSHASIRFRPLTARWAACGVVVLAFATGFLSARVVPTVQAQAESSRVFELLIYHTRPGKGPVLESLFRDASKVITDHGMQVVGYWVPEGDPAWADTLVYLVAHPSQQDAKTRWDAIHKDPTMRVYIREAADNIIERVDNKYHVDEIYMRPTEYSAMK